MSINNFFCVIGLGKSGFSAAKLLLKKKVKVKVTDCDDNISLRQKARLLRRLGAEVELGAHRERFYKGASMYIISPGVNKDNPVVEYVRRKNHIMISEIELAWMFSPAKIIAITGTNGKTSVTTYTYKILKKAGLPVYMAGNIGMPFTEIVLKLKSYDLVVLEVSSFQLENIIYFHPFIAVLLNIAEDHLDRYKNIEEYLDAKFNIFKNQNSKDIAILDLTCDLISIRVKKISAQILDVSKLKLPGLDSNKKFVYAIGKSIGIDERFLLIEMDKLKALRHRIEDLGTVSGVRFINDSKATNPHATKWALKNINSDVILIAGGRDKNTDFKFVKEEVAEKVKALILLGEAKNKILSALGGFVEVVKIVSDLNEAVKISLKLANQGDTILLSPMCASFDMFKNYEERGDKFREIVQSLKLKCRN